MCSFLSHSIALSMRIFFGLFSSFFFNVYSFLSLGDFFVQMFWLDKKNTACKRIKLLRHWIDGAHSTYKCSECFKRWKDALHWHERCFPYHYWQCQTEKWFHSQFFDSGRILNALYYLVVTFFTCQIVLFFGGTQFQWSQSMNFLQRTLESENCFVFIHSFSL